MTETDLDALPGLASPALPVKAGRERVAPRLPAGEAKFKRLPRQSSYTPPEGAKSSDGLPVGYGRSFVPVSSVAKDWGISSRRVRMMLAEGRLEGRQLENGYWEVIYPYRYVFGTRGPAIKRQRELSVSPKNQKKREYFQEW